MSNHIPLEGYLENQPENLYTRTHPPEVSKLPSVNLDKTFDQSLGRDVPTEAETVLVAIPKGFIHDVVASTRNVESPTDFCIWSGFYATSCALQRRAWIWPHPFELYPNLFLIYMAPPAINKKSTTVNFVAKILRKLPALFDDPGDKELFSIPIHDGSVTPEGLFDLLEPRSTTIYEEGSIEPIEIPLGSRLALIVDELAAFMGKQKYNSGQITKLINLYDCKEKDSNYTIKGKLKVMENVFFNLFAATTPSGFQDSIPAEAHGGGFLSRIILVRQDNPTRYFSRPRITQGSDNLDALASKLGWIARFKGGEYTLSQGANDLYEKWYHDYRNSFREGMINSGDEGNGREDVMLMKIAMLIKAQSYTLTREINEADMRAAILLVGMIEDAKKSVYDLITPSDWSKRINTVTKRLQGRPRGVTRKNLAGWISRECNTKEMDEVLSMLHTSGKIEISLDGEKLSSPHKSTREVYTWIE